MLGRPAPTRPLPSRFLGVLLLVLLVAVAGCSGVPSSAQARPAAAKTWFGVLEPGATGLAHERAAGISLAVVFLDWDRYEPSEGHFSTDYVNSERRQVGDLRRAGFKIVLDAGVQYPPSWVFREPNAYFVDQYGDRYQPQTPGSAVANAVFDPQVRAEQAAYIARIARDFGSDFFAVRVGGGWNGELHYPPSDYAGHHDLYWAFDRNALRSSPVASWRPGTGTSDDAQRFWSFYIGSLAGYEKWQLALYGRYFSSSRLELLLPGWGLRPEDVQAAVDDQFAGDTPAQASGEMSQGNDFATEVAAVTSPRVVIYSTWLDAAGSPSGVPVESPIAYLKALATAHGLAAAGENAAGPATLQTAQICLNRVATLRLAGMMWLGPPQVLERALASR